MFAQQHAQDDFDGGGMPSVHQGPPIPFSQVIAHLLIQLVILEQHVELLEHRIGLSGHFGHTSKHIF